MQVYFVYDTTKGRNGLSKQHSAEEIQWHEPENALIDLLVSHTFEQHCRRACEHCQVNPGFCIEIEFVRVHLVNSQAPRPELQVALDTLVQYQCLQRRRRLMLLGRSLLLLLLVDTRVYGLRSRQRAHEACTLRERVPG